MQDHITQPYGFSSGYEQGYYDYNRPNVRQQRPYGQNYQGRQQDYYNQYRNQQQPYQQQQLYQQQQQYPRYDNYNQQGYVNYNRNRQQQRFQQDYSNINDNNNQSSYLKVNRNQDKEIDEKTTTVKEEDKTDYKDPNWKDQIKVPPKDTRVKTEDVTQTKGSTFEQFNLKPQLLRAIYEYGFEKPSPIQEESIPNVLMGHSLLARAKNGTGKTGAYTIPVLQLVDPNKQYVQAVILVPTRELSLQTSKFFMDLSKYLKLNVVGSTGGIDLADDIIRLKRDVHVIVATPGRLLDLARHGHARLAKCSIVVLDEADKLLSADFQDLILQILKYIPSKIQQDPQTQVNRQLLLYSATFPQWVSDFCQKWLPDAKMVNLMDELTLKGVTQFYAYIPEKQKVHAMFTLIKKIEINQCIIFCRSKNRVELLARKLTLLGFSCFYIHKDVSQKDRNRIFHEFRQGATKCRYLVCTDLITRGIDIQSVNVVINFDFPKSSETYLHRIGRAGRFGHLALAINFITDEDREALYQIEAELNTEIKPIPNEIDKIDKKLYTQ